MQAYTLLQIHTIYKEQKRNEPGAIPNSFLSHLIINPYNFSDAVHTGHPYLFIFQKEINTSSGYTPVSFSTLL